MSAHAEDTIVWTGDLDDDCTARWRGLMLRAEWMNGPNWWWAVSNMATGEEIRSSNDDSRTCTAGASARACAEKVARDWLHKHP